MTIHSAAQSRIIQALSSLLQQRRITQVTTAELISKAHVAKSTFYHYYHDKYAVLNSLLLTVSHDTFATSTTEGQEAQHLHALRQLQAARHLFANGLSFEGQNSLRATFFEQCHVYVNQNVTRRAGESAAVTHAFAIRFYSRGVASAYIDWILAAHPEPPEALAAALTKVMPIELIPILV